MDPSSPKETCPVDLVLNYSVLCLPQEPGAGHPIPDDCYPISETLSIWSGIWCLVNAVVGASGNLLTLVAIPYAKYKKKYGFHRHWDSTTLFILNLALSDLAYCLFNLPLYALQYLSQQWPLSKQFCYLSATFRYINAFADWMSLAIIALSRCVGLLWPKVGKDWFSGLSGLGIIAGIWVYATLMLAPIHLEIYGGTFGYNCLYGKCDFIMSDPRASLDPHQLLYGIGFSVPCVIIFISYFTIYNHVKNAAAYLKASTRENQQQLQQRDLRMTWTLSLVCFCYLLFVMPITLLNVFDPQAQHPQIHLALFCVYWLQYSLNFFIYAARSEHYRKAYLYFLRRCHAFLCCRPHRRAPLSPSVIFFIDAGRNRWRRKTSWPLAFADGDVVVDDGGGGAPVAPAAKASSAAPPAIVFSRSSSPSSSSSSSSSAMADPAPNAADSARHGTADSAAPILVFANVSSLTVKLHREVGGMVMHSFCCEKANNNSPASSSSSAVAAAAAAANAAANAAAGVISRTRTGSGGPGKKRRDCRKVVLARSRSL